MTGNGSHEALEDMDLRMILENVEGAVIRKAWEKHGSSTKVARALNIGQTTAARKIRKYVKADPDQSAGDEKYE